MKVAIYARKSTSQEKASPEAKSVTRQIELSRDFIGRQDGWHVAEDHVYKDEAVSGGEFDVKKRSGLAALQAAARSTPRPFDILVVMNQSRLARRLRYAVDIVHDLADAGVRIFFYQTGLERKMDSAADRFMVGVDGFQDESYRESIQITTRETMRQKAKRGEVAGGKLFGYVNVRPGGPGTPAKRVIEESQAALLRRMFEMVATGKGFVRIAKQLNGEGIPAPTGHGWAPSAVRAMVMNPHYRGEIIYGKTRWEDRGDTKVKVDVPEALWDRLEIPAYRIIPEVLWQAAHDRLGRTRAAYLRHTDGRVWGRPETGIESPYLLTGMSECSTCGGSFNVRKRPDGKNRGKPPAGYYCCARYHTRGPKICANALPLQMQAADDAVLALLRDKILHPDVISLAIEKAMAAYQAKAGDTGTERTRAEAELKAVQGEIDRLVGALAGGVALDSITAGLKDRERRKADLLGKLEHLDGLARTPRLDSTALQARLKAEVTNWREALKGEPVKARQILRRLIKGRLTFTPDPERGVYEITGEATYGRLLATTVGYQDRVCPRGDSNTRHVV